MVRSIKSGRHARIVDTHVFDDFRGEEQDYVETVTIRS